MSGSSSLPPSGLILLGPLKKACRRAPRALSCFILRSLDLLFWNQTWNKPGSEISADLIFFFFFCSLLPSFFNSPFTQTVVNLAELVKTHKSCGCESKTGVWSQTKKKNLWTTIEKLKQWHMDQLIVSRVFLTVLFFLMLSVAKFAPLSNSTIKSKWIDSFKELLFRSCKLFPRNDTTYLPPNYLAPLHPFWTVFTVPQLAVASFHLY